MTDMAMSAGMTLAAILMALGLIAVLVRRDLVFILIGIEIMLNAAGLAFITAGARWGQTDGQIMFMLIITLAASEAAVGLALILQIERRLGTLDADQVSKMRG